METSVKSNAGVRVLSRLVAYGAVVLTTAVVGCQPAPPLAAPAPPQPPTAAAAPKPPAPASPVASSSPAASASPSPAAKPAAQATVRPDWQAEWDRTVAAAKQEGSLVMGGNPGDVWRQALLTFEQEYPGIKIEWTGIFGRDFYPKFWSERQAGQYLWDLRIGGSGSEGFEARDRGDLESVRDVLLLPEVVDESKWLGGLDGQYDDKEKKYLLSFQGYIAYGTWADRNTIPESEFNSVKDLLDPKWKGKITLQDPRGAAGLAHMSVYYYLYGEEFVRDLLTKQDIVVTNDARQQAEWIIRGRYPLGIGVSDAQLSTFRQQGLGENVKVIREAGTLSTGIGGIQLFTKAPHPNAAKVFINWLLTRNVQERVSRLSEQNSRRLDVAPVDPSTAPDPARLKEYPANQTEEFFPIREKTRQLAAQLIKQ